MERDGSSLLLVSYLSVVAAQKSPRGEPFDELDVAPLDQLPATTHLDHVELGNGLELVHVAAGLVRDLQNVRRLERRGGRRTENVLRIDEADFRNTRVAENFLPGLDSSRRLRLSRANGWPRFL